MAAIWITQICAVVEINPRRPIQCESNKCPARPDIVELSTLRTDIETESINGSKSIPKLSISAAAWRMLAQSSSRILFAICGQRERERTRRKDTRLDSRMLSIAFVNRTKPRDDANFITQFILSQIRRRA